MKPTTFGKWLSILLVVLTLSSIGIVPVAADTKGNAFDPAELVHYNQSYAVAVLPVTSTSEIEWLVLCLLGIICLVGSSIGRNRVLIDVLSILASMFIFIATVKSFAIDTITSYGTVKLVGAKGATEWVTLVNHTIYHYDLWGVAFGILFVIALGNQWRLWLEWQRTEEI